MSQETVYALQQAGLELLPTFLWIAIPTILVIRLAIWFKRNRQRHY